MKLNQLSDNPGATKKRKRIGRGPGSGTGKMGGRGIKGQKSRSGVAINGYEGGQMPLYQRLPKRGFNNINAKTYAVVNLGLLQKFIDEKKIDIKKPITQESLVESGLVRRVKDGVRILNKGAITSKIDLTVSGASKAAIAAIEAAGGKLTVITAPKLDAEA
jgi:large subunit ribosomal protein L15